MLIDGRKIAEEVRAGLKRSVAQFSDQPLLLGIVVVGNDPVIESFVRIKKRVALELGISVEERRFADTIGTEELLREVTAIGNRPDLDGLIIQLPLPRHVATDTILNAVRVDRDVDMLSRDAMARFREGTSKILPPVVGAIEEILERSAVSVHGKDVLILGHGRLVGDPASIFFRHNDAQVTVVGREVTRLGDLTREADIIICGAGQPGLLEPGMLKEGVVIIDAGTSEAGGKIVGDADPRCAEVASILTPVPGGVGPVAVAMIFKNLLILARERRRALS